MNEKNTHIVLALTGASGMPYAYRLLELLLSHHISVDLIYSKAAQIVAMQECRWILPNSANEAQQKLHKEFSCSSDQLNVFSREDWFAPCASGSNPPQAMVICPASMNTVAHLAHGMGDSLIERVASVCLKERKQLIIVPREMPLSQIHLQNLLMLSQVGVHIIPPMPAFYHHPQTVEDLVDFVVARILDHLDIQHDIAKRWGDEDLKNK